MSSSYLCTGPSFRGTRLCTCVNSVEDVIRLSLCRGQAQRDRLGSCKDRTEVWPV